MLDLESKFYLDKQVVFNLIQPVYLDEFPIVNHLNSFNKR